MPASVLSVPFEQLTWQEAARGIEPWVGARALVRASALPVVPVVAPRDSTEDVEVIVLETARERPEGGVVGWLVCVAVGRTTFYVPSDPGGVRGGAEAARGVSE